MTRKSSDIQPSVAVFDFEPGEPMLSLGSALMGDCSRLMMLNGLVTADCVLVAVGNMLGNMVLASGTTVDGDVGGCCSCSRCCCCNSCCCCGGRCCCCCSWERQRLSRHCSMKSCHWAARSETLYSYATVLVFGVMVCLTVDKKNRKIAAISIVIYNTQVCS